MSKKRQATRATARPGKGSTRRADRSSTQSRRPRRRAMAALALIIASIAATGIVAAQGGLGALVSAPSALRKLASGKASGSGATSGGASRATSKAAAPVQSPTPPSLTKEYIYAGSKLIATEEPTPSGPAPHINSINPISGDPGQDIEGFTVTGTHLAAVNRIVSDNSSLSGFVSSASDSSVTGRLTIDQGCPPGPHQIWVVTSGGQPSDNTVTFTVNPLTGGPVITDLSPAQAKPGDIFTMTITGRNLDAVNQVKFLNSAGQSPSTISVNAVTPLSGSGGTVVTASISINSSAVVGGYTVSVSNPTLSSGSLPFTINPAGMVINRVTPPTVAANTTVTLTIKGTGLATANTVTVNTGPVPLNAPGFSETNIIATNTQVTCDLHVAATVATSQFYYLAVSGPGGTSNYIFLAVAPAGPAPVVNSLSPSSQPPCTTFGLTIAGSNLSNTSSINVSPATSEIIVTGLSSSANQVTATLFATQAATLGQYTLSVTTPYGNSGGLPFTLAYGTPSITNLGPTSASQGTTGLTLTITGSNLAAGCGTNSINFLPAAGITVTSATYTANQITASVNIGFGAAAGVHTVTVTTQGGTSSPPLNFTVNLAPPPAPTNLTATAVAPSQINLAWTVNSPNETGFKVERKPAGGNYSQIAVAAAQTSRYIDTGLSAGTTYYYRVRATNSAGDSVFTNEFNATTAASAPAPPTSLAATAFSTTQINLTWSLNTAGVVGLKLERMPAGGSFAQVAVLCPVTSYSDTGLTQNATYSYRIRCYNAAGDGAYSSTVTQTTQGAAPPPAPINFTATAVSPNEIDLTWAPAGTTQTGFKIYTNGTGTGAPLATLPANATSYQDMSASPGTTSCYTIRATNGAGDSPTAGPACATPPGGMAERVPQVAPARLLDKLIGYDGLTRARLPWANTDLALIDNGAGFSIVEYNAALQGAAPAVPGGLIAWPVSGSQVNLSWVPGDTTQTSFNLQRSSANAFGGFADIAKIQCANLLTYSDTGLSVGVTYYYRILATNANGSSAYSAVVSATPTPAPSITSISPNYVLAGTATPYNLTVNGSNFLNGANASVVNVNGTPRTTTYVNSSQLTAALTTADLGSVATLAVTVVNPGSSQSSNVVNLNVVANNTPTITSLSPTNVVVGSAGFNLVVNGANYVDSGNGLPGSTVKVNGSARTTTFNGPGQLTAAIPASDLTTAANLAITVTNPAPGTTSAGFTFAVNNPPPSINTISPASVIVNTGAFSLTVNGSGFVNGTSGSVVKVGSNARTTHFVNSGQVTADMLASDITSTGSLTITVFNPGPGGGTSNSKTLTVNPAQTIPPAPTGVTATAQFSTQILVGWSYSGTTITGFQIFRNSGGGYGQTPLATVPAGTTVFSDTTVTSGIQYCYKVRAYNSAGTSPDSNESCDTTP